MLILDVHIHSVFNHLTILVNSTMESKANSVSCYIMMYFNTIDIYMYTNTDQVLLISI